MPIKKIIDRQYPLIAMAKLGLATVGAANAVTMSVPVGALVTDIRVFTVTAFNTGGAGTATATVTDGTTVFANAVDVKTAGAETVANAPKFYPTGGTFTATITETVATTAATAGEVYVTVEYVIDARGNELSE